jgi:hypothetical protein
LNILNNQLDPMKPEQLNAIFSNLPNLSALDIPLNQLDKMKPE